MNLPNQLTLSRVLLTVVFMFFLFSHAPWGKPLALATFILASLTDYWDGRIARATHQITNFGKLMDPIADKLLSLSAFIAFVQMEIIPAWMVVLIVTRDFLITGLRLLMPRESVSMAARSSGKHKTTLQFAAIVGVLIFLSLENTPLWRSQWSEPALNFIYYAMFLIVGMTLWSGIHYAVKNRDLFNPAP